MKKLLPLFLLLIIFCSVKAQKLTDISGVITGTTSQPVSGATITLLNTNFNTISNAKGEFSINRIPEGNYVMHISNVAYAERSMTITVGGKGMIFNIKLKDANNQLDEVVVTAQKREEAVQQVPISISTLSAKQVQAYGLQNLKEITAIVPNLYSAGPGDNRNVTGIRGIATTSYDPAVVTYVDGVNQFSLDTYIPQLFDVERIEVLRGPQGTLYGRNALGGVINVITKQPSNQTSGFAEIEFGNYGEQRYSLGLRTALIKNKLFLGVAGVYSGFDGFYTNTYNNTKFDKQHFFLGNYYLKFLASDKLTLNLNVKNYANRNNGPFQLAGSPQEALSNPFKVDQNATTKMIDNIFNASLSANYSGSNFNFTSVSSYQENYRYYTTPIDGDFSADDAVTLINNYGNKWNNVKVGTQEFRFSSPASSQSPLKWTAGLYGFYRHSPTKTGTHLGDGTNLTFINTNIENNYGAAAYGQAVYTITPKWDITAGIRYDFEHKKEEVKGETQPDGQDAAVTQADTSSKANFRAFTPKLAVAYHLTDKNNLFATYSRGFRAGGISQLGADPSQPPLYAYKPEYSDNYEVGSKNSFFNKKLTVNISAFYTAVNNAQVPTLVLPGPITITKNAGKLKSKGIEAEIAATLLKGFDVAYNFGYTHARYTDLLVASNGDALNLKGNHQVYTPDVTSMLALQYAYALVGSPDVQLIARGEWKYLGNQYFDLANQIEQKAYNLFNARIGVSTKHFDVFLWGKNLAEKKYIDYAYDFGASHLGNPRTYGISLRTNF
ncbi:TonB-dependent receptor [Mucilaginibacter sp. BJC16-A38]|uniref:TonB-dependent receptor n=1 Tax=Mucilaginibacter phenanthrenivorans TaxID=1234842 RepID=UPI00215883FD|nr:TonB-dependent receptor [Mucilaginibacter phenanthrenivorans]MCR8559786.1 TonB-dependent receptor [Mucilaginibacter phenanthrenivorans]